MLLGVNAPSLEGIDGMINRYLTTGLAGDLLPLRQHGGTISYNLLYVLLLMNSKWPLLPFHCQDFIKIIDVMTFN